MDKNKQLQLWASTPIPPIPLESPRTEPIESGESLVYMNNLHPRIRFLASYAEQNIPGANRDLYLRQTVSDLLCRAVELLPEDMGLAIFDGLRPMAVQQALFDDYKARLATEHPAWDEATLIHETCRFVAYPDLARPSGHLTGGAVDLTLCCGDELLDLGTVFDDFRPIAGTRYFERDDLTDEEKQIRDNRRILYHLLTSVGFTNYDEEWWHFDYGNTSWARQKDKTPFYGGCEAPGGSR